jgi:dihydroorotate dehydrogenase (fumarate)
MVELRTRYLGLDLPSPLVASASPLTGTLDGLRRLEAAGAAAVVLPSLFKQLSWRPTRSGDCGRWSGQPVGGGLDDYNAGPYGYLAWSRRPATSRSR